MSDFPSLELEALQHLEEQAVAAAGNNVQNRIALFDHPDKRCKLLVDKNGDHEVLNVPPPPRNHKLLTCNEVVAYARLMKPETPIVWIGAFGIVVTHDAERILGHKADYRFRRTEEFKYVQEDLGKEPLSQKDFLALLRIRLARSFDSEDLRMILVKSVRSLKTSIDQTARQGGGSYETGLVSTANEKIEWPDTLKLRLSVFEDSSIDMPQIVECVLDVDPTNVHKPFTITPIKSDLAKAISKVVALASDVIRAELDKETISVFTGEPSAS